MASSDSLFTRDEVLEGFPAQRARALLFLIESRTAHWSAQARRAMERYLPEEVAEERDLAFLEAFALGKDPPLKPTIQDIERYAARWADQVPDNPRMRATLGHLLGQKYVFTHQAVPGIRRALKLDEQAVQRAYQRQYQRPLQEIYAAQPGPIERLRWAWVRLAERLDALPPFWTAFSITLTETVGASILALPIALAEVGPLAGLGLLVVLGLVNVLTIVYVAETLTRTGSIRYGSAYFGRLVAEYLGRGGALLFSLALILLNFLVLIAYFTGIAKTMEAATHLPATLWVALVFLIILVYIRRDSINAAVNTALLVGAVNISLILLLSLLTLPHVRAENLTYLNLPFLNGQPFEPSILSLVFGIVLAAYFGHTSLANCAKIVLQRDESGRSLILGSLAAEVTTIGLYSIWLLAVNGSIAAAELSGQSGTALTPLAARVGSSVHVLGSIFVFLGMGVASIHFSMSTLNLVRERLPSKRSPIISLSRRHATLIFRPRGKRLAHTRLGLVYLGLADSQPKFRLDVQDGQEIHRMETVASGSWAVAERLGPEHGRPFSLDPIQITVLDASRESVRLEVTTRMSIVYTGEWDSSGLEMSEMLSLPDEQRWVLNSILRQGQTRLDHLAAETGLSDAVLQPLLAGLTSQGYISAEGTGSQTMYRARLAVKRGRRVPDRIWQALGIQESNPAGDSGSDAPQTINNSGLSERTRFWIGVAPLALIFLLVEWLILTENESFVEPLSFAGVIIVSLIAGVFPVLLLASSRRKGEFIPEKFIPFFGHPIFMIAIYLFSLASIFIHGLVIWQNPLQQATAILTGVLFLGATIWMFRMGAFAPRAVIELRQDSRNTEPPLLRMTSDGRIVSLPVQLEYRDGAQAELATPGEIPSFHALNSIRVPLPNRPAPALKVWAYKITQTGEAEGLPVLAVVQCGGEMHPLDLKLTHGQGIFRLEDQPCQIEIRIGPG